MSVIITRESGKDAWAAAGKNYFPYAFREQSDMKVIAANSATVTQIMRDNREAMLEFQNSNTIDSDLLRQAILVDMLEAFSQVLLNLNSFCFVAEAIPMEGNDQVIVPFFPLQANASSSFDKTTGYATTRDWTQQRRKVTVGGDGDTSTSGANAAANTAKDRKYIGLSFSSYDLDRNPFLMMTKLAQQNANRLAVDVFTDIISRCLTVANFPTAVKSVASTSFSSDDVADMAQAATTAMWPLEMRTLTMGDPYGVALLKDPSLKFAANWGDNEPVTTGNIAKIYGFNEINIVPNLASYGPSGEHLQGWMNHKSALLVATANVMPTPEVRALMTRFDIVRDPKTGLGFAYRRMGNATLDKSLEIIEVSYGAAVGVETALQRITDQ